MKQQDLDEIRRGMHALFDHYKALRICSDRYLEDWKDELPKGWALDELEACLERPLPDSSVCIDPDGHATYKESIEEWVMGCKASRFAETIVRRKQAEIRAKDQKARIQAALVLIGEHGCDCEAYPGDLHTCLGGRIERALTGMSPAV